MTPWRAFSLILFAAAAGIVASAPVGAVVNLFGFHCCYYMASRSMLPTLPQGKMLGALAYSLSDAPEAGDVILFQRPARGPDPYVKRIIGRPGDRVQMMAGNVYVNGKAVERERIGDFVETSEAGTTSYRRWRETLASGVSYETIDQTDSYDFGNTPVFAMPAGEYFVLGDARDNSWDSRDPSRFGNVPLADILGKVKLP
jgi:signal peptidase I